MEKQYLIAHIEIPIEVTENQDYNILNERTSIRFDPCTELPPITEDTVQNSDIFSALFTTKNETNYDSDETMSHISDTDVQPEGPHTSVPFITQLLKKKLPKKRERITFKRRSSSSNGTRKVYSNFVEKETDLSQINDLDNV